MRFYTKEMREIALKNAAKYDWAKELVKKAVERADYLLEHVDQLYDLFPSEGVPRSTTMSTWYANDQVLRKCPYCGMDVQKETRFGAWHIDPIEHPWKVVCPKCQSQFPSNDFGLLYKRGLNEQGEYDRALALKNNAEAVARGEKDALVNELFPDKESTWLVDDGFGWSLRDGTYGTIDDDTKWAPVAYYHHHFWYGNGNATPNSTLFSIEALRDAYLYTGDIKYGRAGAILLDRAADLYPAYDHKKVSEPYSASHGMGWNGKILGSIWENFVALSMIKCYDAFTPVMGDPEVIDYLSKKAKELNLKNPKTSEELIRENGMNNIVREVFRATKEGQIYGNFGFQQKVIASAAVVCDNEAEVKEMLDWLKHPGGTDVMDIVDPIHGRTLDLHYNSKGGELVDKYIDEIDHDGFGCEIGITYNKIWFIGTLEVAEILDRCEYNTLDLFNNPKVIKMFDSFIHETIANGTSLAMGDSGYTVSIVYPMTLETLRGYKVLRDPKLAQMYDFYVQGDYSNAYIDMFTDTEELVESLKKDVATYGRYQFESDNLTGFGLTVLREGQPYFEDDQYDTWMYYGRTELSHAHRDCLQLGVDAYGLDLTPDLGYPEKTAYQPNRLDWVKASISHNVVVVNGDSQVQQYSGKSKHYDSTDVVKMVDVDGSDAYEETDIYRRTAVTIAVDDKIGYTLDFFRVKGGDSHMYSFHAQSNKGYASEGITFTPQVDAEGNYVGTYASPDFEYGHDPASTDNVGADKTFYPRGFTWLTHVDHGVAESGNFMVDFAIQDFRSHSKDAEGVRMQYRALNDWTPSAVDMTTGYPPQKLINMVIPGLDYMFVHREGKDLDTLFTSLIAPYKHNNYIADATSLAVNVKAGAEGTDDVVKAVKVVLTNGLTDYVVYATNNDVTYEVVDGDKAIAFKGFVGVYRVDANGNNVYTYMNDGVQMGDVTGVAAYTGTIVDFTKDFVAENSIAISLDQDGVKADDLVGRYVYADNTSKRNAVYRIEKANVNGKECVLHLGNTTLIERFVDKNQPDLGYAYTIAAGQKVRIPLSVVKTVNE